MGMSFCFNITGDPNWNAGTMFFYNGDINEVQPVHNMEELKYMRSCWKECTGRELKTYSWNNMAPVYVRVFGTLCPTSKDQQVLNEIKKLEQLINK